MRKTPAIFSAKLNRRHIYVDHIQNGKYITSHHIKINLLPYILFVLLGFASLCVSFGIIYFFHFLHFCINLCTFWSFVCFCCRRCNAMHCNHFAYWFCIGKSRFYFGLFLHSSLVRVVVNWCWNWNTLSDYEFTMNMFSVNCLFNLSGAGRESDMWQAPVTITLQHSVSIPNLNISIRS